MYKKTVMMQLNFLNIFKKEKKQDKYYNMCSVISTRQYACGWAKK